MLQDIIVAEQDPLVIALQNLIDIDKALTTTTSINSHAMVKQPWNKMAVMNLNGKRTLFTSLPLCNLRVVLKL